MKFKKRLKIVLSLMAVILFTGCQSSYIDVKKLGDDFCKDLNYTKLTDYLGSLNINAYYNSYFELEGKYYADTNIYLECDNEHIFKHLIYYDPARQDLEYSKYGTRLVKSSISKCIKYDKWGYCSEFETTYLEGKPKLLRH